MTETPQPAKLYDALVPLDAPGGAPPYDIPAGGRVALWVDVSVPATTLPGEYVGRLTFRSDTHADSSLTVSVEVYDFVLPTTTPLAAVGAFDYRALFRAFVQRDGRPFVPNHLDRRNESTRQGLTVLRQLMVLARTHRLDLFEKAMHPPLKRDRLGRIRLDWSDYDNIVKPYLDGSAFADHLGVAAWAIPFRQDWPDPNAYGGADSAQYIRTARAVAAATAEHFRQLGATRRAVAWCVRGPIDDDAYARQVRLGRWVRDGAADCAILCPLPLDPPQLTGWPHRADLASFADIRAVPGEWTPALETDTPAETTQPVPGRPNARRWLRPGQPPFAPSVGLIASAADVRALGWLGVKYGMSGLFFDEVLNWSEDPFHTPAGAETRLFYPGPAIGVQAVLPSVRLKRLRRALQDAAALWILKARGYRRVAGRIVDAMVHYCGRDAVGDHYLDARLNGWRQDVPTWLLARRILYEEILSIIKPTVTNRRRLFQQRLQWDRFSVRTREVHVEQVRCRIGPNPAATTAPAGVRIDPLRAVVRVDLFNEFARPVNATVTFGNLPDGITPGPARSIRLGPYERHVVVLDAGVAYLADIASGKTPWPILLTIDDRAPRALVASAAHIRVRPTSRPPTIDGDLGDWPIRAGNTAGTFRLLGRRGTVGTGLASRQTTVFAMRDDKMLYFAFRCDEPQPDTLRAAATNSFRFEQLMAVGEDLVEIVLDPGSTAKGPWDLYHLMIKANAVFAAQTGVPSTPPLGPCRPWASGAKVATSRGANYWTVEVAIPLASLGDQARTSVWGVNFGRYTPRGSESSNWTGAKRILYDVHSLGTMVFDRGLSNR